MSLSDTSIRNAKPREKPFKVYDGEGLYLQVTPSGGKWWRLKYRFADKEKLLSLGTYPKIGLKEARALRTAGLKLVANGVDPSENRKATKAAKVERDANSFEVIAREWLGKFSATWVPSHGDRIIARFDRDIFPKMGGRPIAEINAPELLAVVRHIEKR
ncbi:MAG: integrase arm-type DNA-binding domain-containing protein, partial [Rhizobacter sp.]|nr:integrase arm-type DNA-binding domain-containing protein [Burkholderiales bacterium]